MSAPGKSLSLTQVLVCGAAIVTLSMGIRHGFGLWLQPVTQSMDWSRQSFSLAIAILMFLTLRQTVGEPLATTARHHSIVTTEACKVRQHP